MFILGLGLSLFACKADDINGGVELAPSNGLVENETGDNGLLSAPGEGLRENLKEIAAEPDVAGRYLDGWLGNYMHRREFSGAEEGRGGYISINLLVFQEDGAYFGYLNINGSDSIGATVFYDRILVDIKGTEEMIQAFFLESYSNAEERGDLFDTYEHGALLFSLREGGDSILAIWEDMALIEPKDGQEDGFARLDQSVSYILINMEDRAVFMRAFGVSAADSPFFQHYGDDGNLCLELYYDMEKRSGIGVYHGNYSMTGFDIGEYENKEWVDHKFLTATDKYDASDLAEYAEFSTYNEEGRLSRFYSEGIFEGWSGSPYLDCAVEMVFFYRDEGTLERKECHYNPRLFGTTRSSETHYYDANERLLKVRAYITHGSLEDFYIYDGDADIPSYSLTIDHFGWNAWEQGFFKY